MRFSYFLVLLLVTFTAFVQGLASEDNAIHTSNTKSSSNHAIVDGDRSLRNLKGSSTTETDNDAADEERNKFSEMFGKMASIFKGNSKHVKTLETSPAFINAVKKNPALTKILKEDKALVNILAKNPSLIKEFENPAITKSLGEALKNPTVLKSFQADENVEKIIAALPRTQRLTPNNIKNIEQAMTKSTTVNRGISDKAQQLTAWGAAIVGTIIILLIGMHIANKK